jgi:hypothetical protein
MKLVLGRDAGYTRVAEILLDIPHPITMTLRYQSAPFEIAFAYTLHPNTPPSGRARYVRFVTKRDIIDDIVNVRGHRW